MGHTPDNGDTQWDIDTNISRLGVALGFPWFSCLHALEVNGALPGGFLKPNASRRVKGMRSPRNAGRCGLVWLVVSKM
jgi:hypothetical protein